MRGRAEAVLDEVESMKEPREPEAGEALPLPALGRYENGGLLSGLLGSAVGGALGLGLGDTTFPAVAGEKSVATTQRPDPLEQRIAELEVKVEALEQRLKQTKPPQNQTNHTPDQ